MVSVLRVCTNLWGCDVICLGYDVRRIHVKYRLIRLILAPGLLNLLALSTSRWTTGIWM